MGATQSGQQHSVTIEQLAQNGAFNVVRVSEDLVREITGFQPDQGKSRGGDAGDMVLIPSKLREDTTASLLQKENDFRKDGPVQTVMDARKSRKYQASTQSEQPAKTSAGPDVTASSLSSETAKIEVLQKDAMRKFAESVEITEKRLKSTRADNFCADLEPPVIKCFDGNPNKTLNCAQICRGYVECAEERRRQHLERQAG